MERQRAAADAARLRGLRSGEVRRANPKGWRTVACNLPPQDRERLQRIMERDGAKLGTLVREAVQSYLNEVA